MTSEQFSHQIVTNLFISFLSSYLATLQKTTGAVAAELTEFIYGGIATAGPICFLAHNQLSLDLF